METDCGPGGGGAQFIPTVSPHDPGTVLVRCDMTGGYVSRDGGASWGMFNLGGVVRFFAFDPLDARTLYTEALGLWRSRSLRQRVESAMLRLSLALVLQYADVLNPEWRRTFERCDLHGVFDRFTHRSAASLSEVEQGSMGEDRKFAKRRILAHLPTAIVELRAMVEMMEGDAK